MWPKLDGLKRLEDIDTHTFKTLPFVAFEVGDWEADQKAVLERLNRADLGKTLAVRSCVGMEDAIEHEPPGFFDSILNVRASERSLRRAVEAVISSYSRRVNPILVPDKIIVQRQLLGTTMSGVLRVGRAEAEFVEVEFDMTPGRTDTVTSGGSSKRAFISGRAAMLPSPWDNIRRCADELRQYFQPPFFLEFAVDSFEMPFVFQVRTDRRRRDDSESLHNHGIEDAINAVERYGPLSVMTDWNPAEILGTSPLPLDVSLYDELLMNGPWAQGRASVSWATPDQLDLMAVVGGRPYIKIKQSLQSLLPAGLKPDLGHLLLTLMPSQVNCGQAGSELTKSILYSIPLGV